MDNPKVYVKDTHSIGKGLFARETIKAGEIIAEFDGPMYEAEKASDLPDTPPLKIRDHAIQISPHHWRDSSGVARFINHSCEPNCGIKNKIQVVAMKDIHKGEELFMDYEMVENSDWGMKCKCGKPTCRGTIGAYKNLSKAKREEYKGYISEWLTQ